MNHKLVRENLLSDDGVRLRFDINISSFVPEGVNFDDEFLIVLVSQKIQAYLEGLCTGYGLHKSLFENKDR